MPARGRTGLWVAGVVGLAALGGLAFFATRGRAPSGTATPQAATLDPSTPMADLIEPLREGDARALAVLFQKTAGKPDAAPEAIPEAEAKDWVEAIGALRAGFPRFGSYGRSSALTVVGKVIQRFGVDPAPVGWIDVLRPAHDVIASGLNDPHLDVRVTALVETGKLWSWVPGRSLVTAEENTLASWKDGLHGPVVRRLGDREPKSRAAAVVCLGYLPIDTLAAPALAYLEDPSSPDVRKQVLVSFARRAGLLTEDMILRHMTDKEAGIAEVAELVLKTRGLNQEQISLGMMIFHPKPEIRASVIPLLKDRTDIDPSIWLLQLSRDSDETVRLGAVEALAARLTPEVSQRLAEMATTDKSPQVRQAASKFLPEAEKTAALPPLPGSPSLNPKAN